MNHNFEKGNAFDSVFQQAEMPEKALSATPLKIYSHYPKRYCFIQIAR